MKESAKNIIRFIISAIIIVVSLYFALKDINLAKLWNIIVHADYLWVIISIPIILISHWIRASRWKTMLEPALKVKSPSTYNLFSAVMIGYAFNCALPRGGEFVRPFVYSRREKVSFTSVFATVIVERVIDIFTLLFLFAMVFLFLGEQILNVLPSVDAKKVAVIGALVIIVGLVSFYPPVFRFLIKKILKPISNKFYEKIYELFEKFLRGFAIIKSPSRYLRLIIESFAIWFFYTIPLYLMFFSFDFQNVLHLGIGDAVLLVVISGIGVSIAPTPGAIGVYHFLVQNALIKFFGVSPEAALAYATLVHGINFLIQVSVGGMFFMRENIKKIPFQREDIPEKNEKPIENSG